MIYLVYCDKKSFQTIRSFITCIFKQLQTRKKASFFFFVLLDLEKTMGKSRPRFNEKARASSRRPNQRPHLKARDGGLGKATFEAEVQTDNKSNQQ